MQTSRTSKSSSSDDELLLDTEELGVKKKHFLDYDYDPNDSHITTTTTTSVAHGKINLSSNASSSKVSNQLESRRKIIDRPSTSKMATTSSTEQQQQLSNNSVESVYSILSMFGGQNNSSDIASKFLELSKNREMCTVLRQSGCISLLVQIIHSDPNNDELRQKQCLQTLHNIIHCNADDKAGRRETRVIKLIEQLFDYCDSLRAILKNGAKSREEEVIQHPIQAIGTLMKISFDEEHRHAMCSLGALQTISTLIQLDHAVHVGPTPDDNSCITMRRYAGMCLTNLTFGDGNNKALLCSNKNFMKALVDQINSSSDELVQVTASVIRNLSWRADPNTKQTLNEIETVKILTLAAMNRTQENTLKAILSALWNLSNHCAKNKAEICDISGAIEFLIDMLSYEAPSKTMAVVENAGGILRNISSHIAMHEKYRMILRQKNCLGILLQQLKSPSLTIVSNACGTLGNLSQNSIEDQKFLRENGAIPMLRSLIYSKHKMISTGSTIALRHLLACKVGNTPCGNLDSVAKMMDLKELPTLNARKQRALEQELNLNVDAYRLDETSPSTKDDKIRDFEGTSKTQTDLKVQEIEDEEAPTNFSKFYSDQDEVGERSEYQETNLDQITDYSSRYAENQFEEEVQTKGRNLISSEDTMKCYNTEGTPQVISKAGSLTDLRAKDKLVKESKNDESNKKGKFSENASGLQSPEKTVNYCVEGTPGNFSRNDSLSDLEEASHSPQVPKITSQPSTSKIPPPLLIKKEVGSEKESVAATPKSVTFVTSLADETPLMFSRTSSMGSIESAEQGFDDKSSVVSDFSRLASGVISPSELPDSPTQSIPHSPSRSQMRVNQSSKNNNLPTICAPTHEREIIGAEAAEDSVNTFHVENTPAVFSSRTSLSNLSFDDEPKISNDAISKDFQLMKHPSEDEDSKVAKKCESNDVTAEQSDAEEESADDANLLESCINMGINSINVKGKKSSKTVERNELTATTSASAISQETVRIDPQMLKENPMDMMRTGASMLPPYLPVVDEMNKFIVEDSPCNFSLMSGLSAITIDSTSKIIQHQVVRPTAKVEPTLRKNEEAGTSNNKGGPFESLPKRDFDDSLSSLSIESEDETNLLTLAIAAGVSKAKEPSNPINIPPPRQRQDVANESISSVDSCDKDDATNSILEQCIQSGIAKVAKKDSSNKRPLMTSSPKKSMLPTFRANNTSAKKKSDDEDILKECIASGMKTTKHSTNLVQNMAQLSITDPKNAETTSVTAQEEHNNVPHASVTGVGTVNKDQPIEKNNNSSKRDQIIDENTALEKELSRQATWTMQNGSNYEWNLDDNILERSNEYPANKLSMMLACSNVEIEDDSIMDISNEFMIENEEKVETKIDDKHKNPDLMLKSVDRLTQELVSTAEYLRKNANTDLNDKMSNSISNNTWNDEISFPSISMSAPMIGSTNDETTFATDQIQPIVEEVVDGNEKTPTNEEFRFKPIENDENHKIDFKLGGEIHNATGVKNKIPFMSCGPASLDTCSTLSNSTIVDKKMPRNQMEGSTASLMDLENVRPPSSMDSISLCSYQDLSVQQSPMRASLHKKSLMTGLMAKRALGHQVFGGSVESVNSNIDSIRPPSIMDELLDSMISVDSIVSEIVDPTLGISNYETALSDMEDSLTLRNCQDISKDETLTPISSDFSSIESTPKKKRSMRAVTPKQKRQSEKERYKTYTIAVDMLLKEQQEMENSRSSSPRRSLNARQRRQDDRQRFETQVIEISPSMSPSSPKILDGSPIRFDRRRDEPERFRTYNIESVDDDMSICAMTANFEHLRNDNIPTSSSNSTKTITDIRSKLNKIKNGYTNDDSLEYEQQTSETESQRDHKNFSNPQIDENEPKTPKASPTKSPLKNQKIQETGKSLGLSDDALECLETALGSSNPIQKQLQKIQELQMKLQKQNLAKSELDSKPKSSYISPYRMAAKISPTKCVKSVRVAKTPTTIVAKVVTRNSSVELKAANSSKLSAKTSNGVVKNKFGVIPKAKKEQEETSITPPQPPIRQGTFVKDEPTNENVPVVDCEETPAKTTQSKLKPPMRVNSVPAKSSPSSPKKSNLPTSVVQQLKFRSNSNASMKIKESSSPPLRSNTGIILNNPKKNVTSKIAGIWKSPLSKNKSASNSSNQLNGCGSSSSVNSRVSTPTGNVNKKIGAGVKERIKRSSTCEEIV